MASIWKKKDGSWLCGYSDHNGKRVNVNIGPGTRPAAETIKGHIEALNLANGSGTPPDRASAKWVATIGDVLHKRLAAKGLIEPREGATDNAIGVFLNAYIDGKKQLGEGTVKNLRNTRDKLIAYFGATTPIRKIHEGDADDFHQNLVNEEYAKATIFKHIKYCKQFFKAALRKKLVNSNPFIDIIIKDDSNKARKVFIERDILQKVIDVCTDEEFILILILCRYLALRIGEVLVLKWTDIDWKANRVRVESPKTAHQDKGERIVPLFPEVLPYLTKAWDALPEKSSDYVIQRDRGTPAAYRSVMLKLLKKAKIKAWPRLFHNLRYSRCNELANKWPSHVVTEWCGHTEKVAIKHYREVLEECYEQAIQEQPPTEKPQPKRKK